MKAFSLPQPMGEIPMTAFFYIYLLWVLAKAASEFEVSRGENVFDKSAPTWLQLMGRKMG